MDLTAAVFLALHIIDYRQTSDIHNHPELWETNPIIGRHPSQGTVNRYFIGTTALYFGTERFMPNTLKWAINGYSLANVVGNHGIGLRINF